MASAAGTVVLLLAGAAQAFDDFHLDEIAEPVADYAAARVATLEGQGSLTRPERGELRKLKGLVRRLGRSARRLSQDFGELRASATAQKRLRDAGVPLTPALDAAFTEAEIALAERTAYVGDHVSLISGARALAGIERLLERAEKAQTDADAAADIPARRAARLARAERLLTAALKRAERTAQKENRTLPPPRFRSGDLIGTPGGRVAVPGNADSTIAGQSVIISSGAVSLGQAINVSLEEVVDDIVGGDDEPRGPAMRILPEDFSPDGTLTVDVNVLLQPTDDATRLALFLKQGNTLTSTLEIEFLPGGGQIRAPITGFGIVQAGILAPLPGSPDGTYRAKTLQVITLADEALMDRGASIARVVDEAFTFRADGTGSRSLGSFTLFQRRFDSETPHHEDLISSFLSGSIDFTWESTEPGRFTISYTEEGIPVTVNGVASVGTDVISFFGQTSLSEFMTVGVRQPEDAIVDNSDFTGRWATVSMGVQFSDNTTTPFRTRFTNSFRDFVSDGDGTITYGGDSVFSTDIVYGTDQPAAPHTRVDQADTQGGTEDYTVSFDGRVTGASNLRQGYLSPESGVMVSTLVDTTNLSLALEVSVQQPLNGMPPVAGSYHFIQTDIDVITESPETTMSAYTLLPQVGLFTPGSGTAARAFEDSMRAVAEVSGPRGAGTDINWTVTRALDEVLGVADSVPFSPDNSGTHAPESGLRWYAISGDGDVMIGIAPNSSPETARGLFIGVR